MKKNDLQKAASVLNAFSVFEAALTVGRHWKDQEGVNAAYLDTLAEAVERYDEELPPAPFLVDSTPSQADDDRRLAQACRDWHRGALDRATFLAAVEQFVLEDISSKQNRVRSPHVGPAAQTGLYDVPEDRVILAAIHRATTPATRQPDTDCVSCGVHLTYEEAKEHVVECPGPPAPCDECDPSFGCFNDPLRCCKKPVSP